jgi:hypothetical protein
LVEVVADLADVHLYPLTRKLAIIPMHLFAVMTLGLEKAFVIPA